MIIGTRGSELALTQSRWVARQLAALGCRVQLQVIRTQGDKVQHLSLDKMEGKGFFTKEIEQALLDGSIDVAVHSLKDLPSEQVPGLVVAAVPKREDPRDCLVAHHHAFDARALHIGLKPGSRVGTSAVRRKAQLRALRPDLVAIDVRGNVPTRLAKLAAHRCDALLIAMAGLRRLQLHLPHLVVVPLSVDDVVPAPGQGALALQCRDDDHATCAILQRLNHADDAECVACERGLLGLLHAGCHVPLGAHAVRRAGGFALSVFFGEGRGGDVGAAALAPYRFVVEAASAELAARQAFDRIGGTVPAVTAALGSARETLLV